MAYTQTDIDALDAAIKNGVQEVAYRDRTVKYRSLDEMFKIRSLMKNEIAPSSAERVLRTTFDKGYQ